MFEGFQLVQPPEISINNTAQYEFFANLKTNADNLNIFHRFAARVVKPHVVYAPNAEETRQDIARHVEAEKPVLFLLGHASLLDIPIDSATIQSESVFEQLRKKIHTMAKASMFKWPVWNKFITGGLAFPGYRDKDIKKELAKEIGVPYEEISLTDDYKAKKKQLGDLAIQMTAGILDNGDSVANYSEGTRRPHDERTMLPIKRGPVDTIKELEHPEDVMVVVMMKAYGWRKRLKNFRSPTTVVARIPTEQTEHLDRQSIQDFMQANQDLAFELYENRWRNPVSRFLAGL